jgi:DNA-binding NarL/FixJ family response regulator
VREIARAVPETSVVVLSHRQVGHNVLTAVRAGAVGYVPAGFDAPQLRRVISSVLADQVAVPRSLVRDLVTELRELQRAAEEGITGREAEILAMLRHGKTTMAIASQLAISPVTVRRHISKLVQKAGVRDRDELILSARSHSSAW